MTYFEYLKRNFPFYIVCGCVLGLLLFFAIVLYRYNNHLTAIHADLENIVHNKGRIMKEIRQVEMIRNYLTKEFGIDVRSADPELAIYRALDDMKATFHGASITVTSFDKTRGRKELPVSIVAPMDNYRMVLDHVKYLESFRIPDFVINSISVAKEKMGRVFLQIKGSFIMPPVDTGA